MSNGLAQLIEDLVLIAGGGKRRAAVFHVVALHDDNCPTLDTDSALDCRCHPTLVAGGPDESLEDLRRRIFKPRGGVA